MIKTYLNGLGENSTNEKTCDLGRGGRRGLAQPIRLILMPFPLPLHTSFLVANSLLFFLLLPFWCSDPGSTEPASGPLDVRPSNCRTFGKSLNISGPHLVFSVRARGRWTQVFSQLAGVWSGGVESGGSRFISVIMNLLQ